jgi:hypothetical protein
LVFNRSLNFDVNILEKLKSHWSVQPEFQTAASYRKIHISQTVEAMRLKFYEHAHKVISNNFGIISQPSSDHKEVQTAITYRCILTAAFN